MVRPTRFDLVWGAVLLAWSAVLCAVPLFDLLAFEFAFALTLPVTAMAGAAGLRAARRHGRAGVVPALVEGARRALALAALPLVPITLNMLRVRNCDYLEGLALYGLLPGVTALVGAAWGVALGLHAPRRGAWIYGALVLGSIALGVYRFWVEPPVDAFNSFLGYFPGAIYDEVIPLDDRLLWSRGEDVAWALAAFAVAAAIRPPPAVDRRRRFAGAILALLGLLGARGGAVAHDVHRDAAYIQRTLGGRYEAPGLVVHHPAAWPADKVRDLALDLRFHLEELSAFFGVRPSGTVSAYLYPDADTKKRLMGAGRTRIAKPWQRAIHVHAPAVGQPVLRHELAHVVSAELADPPFHVSFYRGLVPHASLIEGVAVAATWDAGRLDPHQWSAAMQRIGVAPPIEKVLRPDGFLTRHSRTAYTLCGSFVHYLHARLGAAALARVYRAGTFDLPAVDGAPALPPFGELVAGWRAMLAEQPLGEAALAVAAVRFDRPAIFGKVCAHEVAALWAAADAAGRRGDAEAARRTVEAILGHVPDDPDAALSLVGLRWRTGDAAGARALATDLAGREGIGIARRARAREWLADLDAAEGRRDAARTAYAELLAAAFGRAQERRLAVKLAAVDAGEAGERVLAILSGRDAGDGSLDAQMRGVRDRAPAWPVGRYLYGRRLAQRGRHDAAIAELERALAAGLPHPSLTIEAERLIAAVHFHRRDYEAAAAAFEALAARHDLSLERGEVASLRTWARRARFFARHRDGSGRRSAAGGDRGSLTVGERPRKMPPPAE